MIFKLIHRIAPSLRSTISFFLFTGKSRHTNEKKNPKCNGTLTTASTKAKKEIGNTIKKCSESRSKCQKWAKL